MNDYTFKSLNFLVQVPTRSINKLLKKCKWEGSYSSSHQTTFRTT